MVAHSYIWSLNIDHLLCHREIYHTKRMQRVTCVRWSLDNRYIVSGSDEMNIRLWKAKASEKLGIVSIFIGIRFTSHSPLGLEGYIQTLCENIC